jgi:SPFH domain / Band 7 family
VSNQFLFQVPHGEIGLQYRRPGRRQPGEPSSRVSILGSPGWQAEVLKGNTWHVRPAVLYEIKFVPQAHVKPRTIGLVLAKEGRPAPPGTLLVPSVECDNFQDGVAFLRDGGYRGLQMQVLTTGHWDINTELFDVITVDNVGDHPTLGLRPEDLHETGIDIGETGVVVTHMGGTGNLDKDSVAPRVPGHNMFQDPGAFLANHGQLGVQSQTLPAGGHYAINPVFAHVVKIPTRDIVLNWSKKNDQERQFNFDASLGPVVLDVNGYTVRLNMQQTLQIPEEVAPRLVRRFGDQGRRGLPGDRAPVQQFVEKVLATTVSAYFRKISARVKILDFVRTYDEIGVELAKSVRAELASAGVKAVATSLEDYECDPVDFDDLRRAIALREHEKKELEAKRELAVVQADIERIGISVDGDRRRLEVAVLAEEIRVMGLDRVHQQRILERAAKMGVPQTLVAGGDVASALLHVMPLAQAQQMLAAMAVNPGRKKEIQGTADDASD